MKNLISLSIIALLLILSATVLTPADARTQKKKGNKIKKKDNEKPEKDYTSNFDPNFKCSASQAHNFCFGSGYRGDDVGTCTCEARTVRKINPCSACIRRKVLEKYGPQPWLNTDAKDIGIKMQRAVDEAFLKAGKSQPQPPPPTEPHTVHSKYSEESNTKPRAPTCGA